MPRVAAIALDAAEWTALEPLMDEGRLPELARLRDRARRCRFDNVLAYRSEQVWPQFLSGRDARTNRYWSTETFDPATYEPYCQGTYVGRPFYADRDIKTIVLDCPFLPLSRGVEGIQVTAWGVHGPHYVPASLPQGTLTEIEQRFGRHPAFENDFDPGWYSPRYIDSLTEALRKGANARLEIARWLQDRVPDWDLILTSMSEIHSAGHHLWHGMDPMHPLHDMPTAPLARQRFIEVAAEVDAAVGRFLAGLPDDTNVVLFALHGMVPADDVQSMVLLPELFHRLQFGTSLLRTDDGEAWRRKGFPPVIPEYDKAWATSTWLRDRFAATPRDRARALAHRVMPEPIYELARRLTGKPPAYKLGEMREPVPPETMLTPEEIVETQAMRKDMEWQTAAWYRRYWPQMPFFALPTFTDAHIRINLKGRERDGIVEPDDYERVCDQVIEIASKITDPRTGKPILGEVLRPREGEVMAPDGPDADLLFVWSTAVDALEHPDVGIVGPVPHVRTGAHNAEGWAMFAGPGIAPGDLGRRDAADLTRTILDLLGREASPDMVGSSLCPELRQAETV